MKKSPFHDGLFPNAKGFKLMRMVAELAGGGHLVLVKWDPVQDRYDLTHTDTVNKKLIASAHYTQLSQVRKHFMKLKKKIVGWG